MPKKTPEERAEYKRKWAEANREKLAEKAKARYLANREARLAQVRAYHHANRDTILPKLRAQYQKNRDERLVKAKEYNARPEIRERETLRRREYYQQNKADFIPRGKVYRQSDRGRAVMDKAHAREKRIHAHKIKARSAVSNALRDGRLVKADACQRCGATEGIEAHHHKGYAAAHRLEVVWLCLPCHKEADREQQEQGT